MLNIQKNNIKLKRKQVLQFGRKKLLNKKVIRSDLPFEITFNVND